MAHLGWQKRVCQTLSSGKIPWTVLQIVMPCPPYPPYLLPLKLPWRSCTHIVSAVVTHCQTCVWLKQSKLHVMRQAVTFMLILLCLGMQQDSSNMDYLHAGAVTQGSQSYQRHATIRLLRLTVVNDNKKQDNTHTGHRIGSALLHRSVDTADLVAKGVQPTRHRYCLVSPPPPPPPLPSLLYVTPSRFRS